MDHDGDKIENDDIIGTLNVKFKITLDNCWYSYGIQKSNIYRITNS